MQGRAVEEKGVMRTTMMGLLLKPSLPGGDIELGPDLERLSLWLLGHGLRALTFLRAPRSWAQESNFPWGSQVIGSGL